MGSEALVRQWKRLLSSQSQGKQPGEKRRFGLVSWEEIIAAIEQEWQKSWSELRHSQGNRALAMAIWFARHRAGMTLEQIRAELGAGSYHAVAMQVGRLQRQLLHQVALRKRLHAIARRLNV